MKLLLLLFVCTGVLSASSIDLPQVNPSHLRQHISLPKGATLVQPPANLVQKLSGVPHGAEVQISLPAPTGTWVLNVSSYSVLTPRVTAVAMTSEGEVPLTVPEHVMLSGTVAGRDQSRVFLAVFATHITGVVEIEQPDGLRRFIIAPDTVIDHTMAPSIVFETALVDQGPSDARRCVSEDLPDYQRKADSIMAIAESYRASSPTDQLHSSTVHELFLALECDSTFYTRQESNLTRAAQYALTLAGACGAVYRRDANVAIRVPFLRIWTQTDPYVGTIGERLTKIREYWGANMRHVQRSVTCMLSGSGGGGLAWVGVLCGGYGFNVSGVDGRVNFPASGYIWDIDVTSHELGHNIGSSHSHNCSWNPPIDSCWYAEGGCFDYVLPQRGNIMSYCHLQYTGNALSFHPRVASLFNRVMESSPCITTEAPTMDVDVDVTAIVLPEAGATIPVGTSFTPQAIVINSGTSAVSAAVVTLRLSNLQNDTLDTQSVNVSLAVGQADTVRFAPLRLDQSGSYVMEAGIAAEGDAFATNNIMTRPFRVGDLGANRLRVVWPNGGETLTTGDTVRVRYTATGEAAGDQVTIQYSTNNGLTWLNVRRSAPVDTVGAEWIVPPTPSTTCRVRILRFGEAQVYDLSDQAFTIRLPRDAEAVEILHPEPNSTAATPLIPRVVVRNRGSEPLTNVRVQLAITWVRANSPSVVVDTVLATMVPGATDTVELAATPLLMAGVQVASLTVEASGDQNPENNRFARQFTAEGLAAPVSLRVEPGPNRVLLSWPSDGLAAVTDIDILRAEGDGELQILRTVAPTVTNWLDTSVRDGQVYDYALRSRAGSLIGVATDRRGVRPATAPYGLDLRAPTALGPTPAAVDVPLPTRLVWSSVPHAQRYVIQLSASADFVDPAYVLVTDNAGWLTAPVQAAQTWWWRARAINEGFTGPWSAPASFTTTASCAGGALQVHGGDGRAVGTDFTWSGGPVTVEWWMYLHPDSVRNSSVFAVGGSDNQGNRFQAHAPWGNRNIYWDYGNMRENGRLETRMLTIGAWTHIALVSDGAGRMEIYQDGQLTASKQVADQPKDLKQITIGSQHSGGYFAGMIDEFRIWTVARTQEQILATMTTTEPPSTDRTGLYAMWRMNESSGATLTDDAGRGGALTMQGASQRVASGASVNCVSAIRLPAPTLVTPGTVAATTVHRYPLRWNAVQGAEWYEVEVFAADTVADTPVHHAVNVRDTELMVQGLPASTTCAWRVRAHSSKGQSSWTTAAIVTPSACASHVVQFTGENDFFVNPDLLFRGKQTTVEYWAYVTAADVGNRSAFNVGEADESTNRFQAHAPWRDRKVFFDFGDTRAGGRLEAAYDNALDGWNHVALTSNGIDDMTVYFNGVQVAQSSFAGSPSEQSSVTIGGNRVGRFLFRGLMSDFRLWNEVRSAQQIRAGMYDRLPSGMSHLIGVWPLDDARGTVAGDLSPAGWDAAATTAPQWQPDTSRRFMQVPPALRGLRQVVIGDTVEYTLHGGPYAEVSYRVTNGMILTPSEPQALRVAWTAGVGQGTICITRTFEGGCVDSACYDVLVQQPVSVAEGETASPAAVDVQPNPATDHVMIRWAGDVERIAVLDAIGRVVATIQPQAGMAASNLDTSDWSVGVYYVTATIGGTVHTQPVIIQR